MFQKQPTDTQLCFTETSGRNSEESDVDSCLHSVECAWCTPGPGTELAAWAASTPPLAWSWEDRCRHSLCLLQLRQPFQPPRLCWGCAYRGESPLMPRDSNSIPKAQLLDSSLTPVSPTSLLLPFPACSLLCTCFSPRAAACGVFGLFNLCELPRDIPEAGVPPHHLHSLKAAAWQLVRASHIVGAPQISELLGGSRKAMACSGAEEGTPIGHSLEVGEQSLVPKVGEG